MSDVVPQSLDFTGITENSEELHALSSEEKNHALMLLSKLAGSNLQSKISGLLDSNRFLSEEVKQRIFRAARGKVIEMIHMGAKKSASLLFDERTPFNKALPVNIERAVTMTVRTEIANVRRWIANKLLETKEDDGAPRTPTPDHAKPHPNRGEGSAGYYPKGKEKMQ